MIENRIVVKSRMYILLIIFTALTSCIAHHRTDRRDDRPLLEVRGARLIPLDSSIGLPASEIPGVRLLSSTDLQKVTEAPATGLFIVDSDTIPPGLPLAMEEFGLTISDDGTLLDENKQPVTAFVKSLSYQIEPEQAGQKGRKPDDSAGESAVEGKASPFPFRCWSWQWWAKYSGGFCRYYEAKTWAYAWGADENNSCGVNKPQTKIDYIETIAEVSGSQDRDRCYNCDSQYSRKRRDIGCFWPAHGTLFTYHRVLLAEGSIRIFASDSWSH